MVITDFLEKNAREYPDDVALVEAELHFAGHILIHRFRLLTAQAAPERGSLPHSDHLERIRRKGKPHREFPHCPRNRKG